MSDLARGSSLNLKGRYYAGDQNEFADGVLKLARYGCGLVGLTDLLIYLMEKDWKQNRRKAPGNDAGGGIVPGEKTGSRETAGEVRRHGGEAYQRLVKSFDEHLARVRGRLGLNGYSMARAFNKRAAERGWLLRGTWGAPKGRLPEAVQDMLERDLPVILSFGPLFRLPGQNPGILMYPEGGGPPVRVQDHYVTVIGILDKAGTEYYRIVSWGKCYLIRTEDYRKGRKHWPVFGPLFSNILYIRDTYSV